jgi:hypothetical protein
MAVAVAMVRANRRKSCPRIPVRKVEGMNTADSTRAMTTVASPTP